MRAGLRSRLRARRWLESTGDLAEDEVHDDAAVDGAAVRVGQPRVEGADSAGPDE